jgi:hypothetical protein
MNCFECAKVNDSVPAVALCQHCSVGLCLDHLVEAHDFRVGGTTYGCAHRMPSPKRLSDVPTGISGAARHHTAGL